MARPTKLTADLMNKIAAAIANGNYHVTACALAGVSESTFYNWKALGEAAERGETTADGKRIPKKYLEFLEAIKKAEAAAEAKRLQTIIKAEAEDWKAAAWYLERRYPKRWGRRDRMELSGVDGGPIETRPDLSRLEYTDLEALYGILKKTAADSESGGSGSGTGDAET